MDNLCEDVFEPILDFCSVWEIEAISRLSKCYHRIVELYISHLSLQERIPRIVERFVTDIPIGPYRALTDHVENGDYNDEFRGWICKKWPNAITKFYGDGEFCTNKLIDIKIAKYLVDKFNFKHKGLKIYMYHFENPHVIEIVYLDDIESIYYVAEILYIKGWTDHTLFNGRLSFSHIKDGIPVFKGDYD